MKSLDDIIRVIQHRMIKPGEKELTAAEAKRQIIDWALEIVSEDDKPDPETDTYARWMNRQSLRAELRKKFRGEA